MFGANEKGVLEGFKVGNVEILISHIQFANNIMVFLRDSLEHVRWLRGILGCF